MATFVAYDNPMQALTTRYAIFRDGAIVDRKSTKQAALRRAISFCRSNLDLRLSMDAKKWRQIVERAKIDLEDAIRLEEELNALLISKRKKA